ncbi:DNA topoisomerase II [Vibrio phage EniLVp02]
MQITERTLTDIATSDAYEYMRYTIEERALASLIDGLKPSQRFCMYSALKMAHNSFKKVAAIGGVVSEYGYHHGEVSAQEALTRMGAEYSKHIPIIEGQGNFGTRLDPEAAQCRYIFARVHSNWDKFYRDTEHAPAHEDLEHKPPKHYLPIIPMILVNGVRGVAKGYACYILPHDPKWVIEATLEYVKTGKITSEPVVRTPSFTGSITRVGHDKWIETGVVEMVGTNVARITEVPTGMTVDNLIDTLENCVILGYINRYEDMTDDRINFEVVFKRGSNMTPDKVIDLLGLSTSHTQNLNAIMPNGSMKNFDRVEDMIREFVDYRMTILPKRIAANLERARAYAALCLDKMRFINLVNEGVIKLDGTMKRKEMSEILVTAEYIDGQFDPANLSPVLSMPIDKLTAEEYKALEKEMKRAGKDLEYWEKTNPKKEFVSDLQSVLTEVA